MCVVSMTGDYFGDRWKPWGPFIPPTPYIPAPTTNPSPFIFPSTGPTQKDFDDLKREVELLRELLKKSKEYDEKNGEKDCEIDQKMEFLKQVAKLVGVDLDEVLKKKNG